MSWRDLLCQEYAIGITNPSNLLKNTSTTIIHNNPFNYHASYLPSNTKRFNTQPADTKVPNTALKSTEISFPPKEHTDSSSQAHKIPNLQPITGPHNQNHNDEHLTHSLISSSCNEEANLITPWEYILSEPLPEGHCVALRLHRSPPYTEFQSNPSNDFWTDIFQSISSTLLHTDEIKYGLSLSDEGNPAQTKRMTFFAGRLSLRSAMNILVTNNKNNNNHKNLDRDKPILKDEHGRPDMPWGFLGSISHKRNTGIALVDFVHSVDAKGRPRKGIGIDIERTFTRKQNVARFVLTKTEMEQLGHVEGVTKEEEVLLRFSLKESVYKAMHPHICQYVGFQEAEITPNSDGTATVKLNLKSGDHKMFMEEETTAHWRRMEGDYFLTTASVTVKDGWKNE